MNKTRLLTVMLPGWATDCRIFRGITLGDDVIACEPYLDRDSMGILAMDIQERNCPAILCGWSLGGLTALQFASHYPQLVNGLILTGIRPLYPLQSIVSMRMKFVEDPYAVLTSFYKQCFLPAQKEDFRWFKHELMTLYLDDMDKAKLDQGLIHLACRIVSRSELSQHPILLCHGKMDHVAPVDEILLLAQGLSNVKTCLLDNCGHAAFMSSKFLELVNEWLTQL